VFITTIPAAVAAGMSMLSTPMPARPMTLRLVAAAMTSLLGLVSEADDQAVVVADDLDQSSLLRPVLDVGVDAALLEDLDGGGAEAVCDENAGHGNGPFEFCDRSSPRRRGSKLSWRAG